MQLVVRATFSTRDAAAKACARVIQPLTNRHDVEADALLFSLTGEGKGLTRVGSPVMGKEDCRSSFQCDVIVQNGGWVPRGLLSVYFHSHPGIPRAGSLSEIHKIVSSPRVVSDEPLDMTGARILPPGD